MKRSQQQYRHLRLGTRFRFYLALLMDDHHTVERIENVRMVETFEAQVVAITTNPDGTLRILSRANEVYYFVHDGALPHQRFYDKILAP